MHAKNGFRYDNKLTAMMVEDMLFDPILGATVLLGIDVPPHLELRLLIDWTTHFTSDDSGVSTGKSFTHAVIAALRSILMPGRVSGIISCTFRQGKLIFQNFDNWYNRSKIFRSTIRHEKGQKKLVHGNDAWIATFRGGSEIRVLPPGFMSDSIRLRSERWNDCYADEWTTFGNFQSLTKTITGRTTAPNKFRDCPVRQNHIHLASTPHYKFHPSYKVIRDIDKQIEIKNRNFARFTCNYTHVPDIERWEFLVSRRTMETMKILNTQGVIDSEVMGVWQEDSMTYYSASGIDECKAEDSTVTFTKNPDKVYIGGFDSHAGSAESQDRSKGDDFALSILETDLDLTSPKHILTIRISGVTAEEMAAEVYKLDAIFNFLLICYDPGGGGTFVRDELRKGTCFIDNIEQEFTPILENFDTSGMMGKKILMPFKRAGWCVSNAFGKMSSDSVLVNKAHREMSNSIDKNAIILARDWPGWHTAEMDRIAPDDMRRFLNDAGESLTKERRAAAEADLAARQLMLVDVLRDTNGDPTFDTWSMYKFTSKEKKDSAYSLIYANFACSCARELKRKGLLPMLVREMNIFGGSTSQEKNPIMSSPINADGYDLPNKNYRIAQIENYEPQGR